MRFCSVKWFLVENVLNPNKMDPQNGSFWAKRGYKNINICSNPERAQICIF